MQQQNITTQYKDNISKDKLQLEDNIHSRDQQHPHKDWASKYIGDFYPQGKVTFLLISISCFTWSRCRLARRKKTQQLTTWCRDLRLKTCSLTAYICSAFVSITFPFPLQLQEAEALLKHEAIGWH